MRIAMIGSGAMGAMFGARFAQTGADVILYDIDEAHIAAIVARGLSLETPDGDRRVQFPATSDAAKIGMTDMAVITVDSNATPAAAGIAAQIVVPEGCVLTLQNGIGNIEILTAALGRERVIAGSTYNSAAKLGPGRVLHSNIGETVIGELDGRKSQHIEMIADMFSRAGLPIEVSDNVLGHVWMKFALNCALNPVCAVTGLRPGEVARLEPARQLLDHVLDEIMAVVAAKGLALSELNPRKAV